MNHNIFLCKKAAFLCKNPAFLKLNTCICKNYTSVKNKNSAFFLCKKLFFATYIFVKMLPFYVKIQLFYTNFCEKRSFVPFLSCPLTNPFIEKTVFYNMVRILLKCSFRGLLKLYVIRHQLVSFTLPYPRYRKHFTLSNSGAIKFRC